MTETLLLNIITKQRLEEFSKMPGAAILITGEAGSGKTAVARLLAARILGIDAEKLDDYPYFFYIQKPSDKQEIPIDSVRDVIKELRLKPVINSPGQAKRAVFIEDAGKLSEEAQNALLKTIEEPGEETVFILTAESESHVLPTIASRTRRLAISPVSSDEAAAYFGKMHSPSSVDSAWQLSRGAPGLLNALVSNDSDHTLKDAVDSAKKFLQSDRYQRVLYLESLSSDKEELKTFLDALSRVLAALHALAARKDSNIQARKLSAARRQVNSSIESLINNASARLICLDLSLNLPI